MGLELVELAMSFEDAFGCELPDEAARQLRTLGDVHRYLLPRAEAVSTGKRCAAQMAFHRLRCALEGVVPRSAFHPDAPLARLRTPDAWAADWRGLSARAVLHLPPPSPVHWLASVLPRVMRTRWASRQLRHIRRAAKDTVSDDGPTVTDLVALTVAHNHGALARAGAAVLPAEVFSSIVTLTAWHFGGSADGLGPETRLLDLARDG